MRTRTVLPLTILLLLAAGGAQTAAAAAVPASWLTSAARAEREARASGRPILIDLYASWCGWCKELDRKVFSTARFEQFARDFVLLRVDTEDGGEGTALNDRFEVESLPTTLIADADLVLIGKVEGFAPTDEYIGLVHEQMKAFHAYEAKARAALQGKDSAEQRAAAAEAHMRGDGKTAAALYRRLDASGAVPADAVGALQYMLADALRLSKDFPGANAALARAVKEAERRNDADLLERSQMLAFTVAQDSGDCKGARQRLERFLADHPQSTMASQAKRALQAIANDKSAQCT